MTRRATALLLAMLLGGALFAAPAFAAQAEPAMIGSAWYWETQQTQNHDTPVGTVSGEAPNPYCPTAPGGLGQVVPGTCADGRLPVEVINGDYEAPDKVSAVAFDLTMLTLGSKVSKFTVSMLEAEAGCTPDDDAQPHGQQCEETEARFPEGKVIQACEVTEIFGDGDASQYSEMPGYDCAGAVAGERKEIKNDAKNDPNDADPDHVWNFDLTPLAKEWAETSPLCTCVMFRPKAPKNAEDDDPNWRVIFAGPNYPKGVKTNLVFTPGEEEGLPTLGTLPLPPSDSGFDSTGSTSSFGSTTVGGGLEPSGGDFAAGDAGAAAGDDAAPEDVAAPEGELAGAELPEVEAMPGYVWLALLAGLIGWGMVRSIVLENAHAHRANGVLAHIHRINADRGGLQGAGAEAAVAAGPLAGVRTGLASIGATLKPAAGKVSSLVGKLPGIKKG